MLAARLALGDALLDARLRRRGLRRAVRRSSGARDGVVARRRRPAWPRPAGVSSAGACLGGSLGLRGLGRRPLVVSGGLFGVSAIVDLLVVGSTPRWRATVSARARSRLARRRPAVFSSSPVACWRRRPNRSRRCVAMCSRRALSLRSRSSEAFITGRPLACTNLVFTGSLWPARRIASRASVLRHAGELEHHAARLDDGDPALRVALAGAHAGLGRLLGEGLVREDVDPHLAATLDLAGHRDTSGLDLAVGQPARLEGLQAVIAELRRVCWPRERPAAGRDAACGT